MVVVVAAAAVLLNVLLAALHDFDERDGRLQEKQKIGNKQSCKPGKVLPFARWRWSYPTVDLFTRTWSRLVGCRHANQFLGWPALLP